MGAVARRTLAYLSVVRQPSLIWTDPPTVDVSIPHVEGHAMILVGAVVEVAVKSGS